MAIGYIPGKDYLVFTADNKVYESSGSECCCSTQDGNVKGTPVTRANLLRGDGAGGRGSGEAERWREEEELCLGKEAAGKKALRPGPAWCF